MTTKNATNIHPGYKHTQLGWIPEEWEVLNAEKAVQYFGGNAFDSKNTNNAGVRWLKIANIGIGKTSWDEISYLPDSFLIEYPKYILNIGDVVMALTRPILYNQLKIAKIGDSDIPSLLNQRVAKLIPRKNNNLTYLFYLHQTPYFVYSMNGAMAGTDPPNIGTGALEKIKIVLPPPPEQRAIATLLSTWDKAIDKTTRLISQKELRKKYLMQQLLTGKKRLKGFRGKKEFHVLSRDIQEVSERNKDSKFTRVLSVTNSKGFINQSEQFGRVVASDDASNYKIVRIGQFAYNPSRVNVGSLDLLRTFEVGILSPMYVVFETNPKNLRAEFLFYQLKSFWFTGHIPMFVQGSVRNSLSFDGLCGMKFFIPSLEEQTAISSVLQTADKEIQTLKNKLQKLKEQKKGLMQVLLTGKVRVKMKETN